MSAGPKVVDAGRLQHGQYRVRASQSWAILVTTVKNSQRFLENQMAQSYRVDDLQPNYNWLRRSNTFISNLELAQVDAGNLYIRMNHICIDAESIIQT